MKPPAMCFGLIGCLVATLPLGCGGEEAFGPGSVTIDTIDGVLHVANRGKGQWTPETAWEVREVLRLGGPAEPEEQLFTNQLLAADIGPDGNVYVLDHFAASLSVFTEEGQLVRTIGRRGRGPSELGTPTGFTWSGDGHLWISDPSDRKYVVFDTTGGFVRNHPRTTHITPRRMCPLLHVVGLGIVDEAASRDGSLVFLRTTVDGGIHDTLVVMGRDGGPSQALMDAALPSPGPEFTEVSRHYVSRMEWAVDPSGGIWTGSPETLRFVKRDWNGDTLMVVTADHREAGLTSEDEVLIAEAMRQSGLERSEIAPVRPLFQALWVIDGGYLLVQLVDTPGEPSSRFDVYDPEGRYLGEVDLGFAPDGLGSLGSRGDRVVAPMLGDLDVPYVVVVELIRPEGRSGLRP